MKRTFSIGAAALLITAVSAACSNSDEGTAGRGSSGVVGDGGSGPGNGGTPGQSSGDGSSGDDGSAESAVVVTNETISVDGDMRSYVLAVPANYDPSKSYPLVLVFHGDGGTGPSMRELYTLDAYSRDEAIVVYPTGQNATWNVDLYMDPNPDTQFVQTLIGSLKSKYTIDDGRIFGSGYSRGGFYIHFLQCRVGLFRAITSHAGGAPYTNDGSEPDCSPGKPAAVIAFHGDADTEVDAAGHGAWTAQYWAQKNGCGSSTAPTDPSPCVAYNGCPDALPVHYCLIPGLGHIPWSQGATTSWEFFKTLH